MWHLQTKKASARNKRVHLLEVLTLCLYSQVRLIFFSLWRLKKKLNSPRMKDCLPLSGQPRRDSGGDPGYFPSSGGRSGWSLTEPMQGIKDTPLPTRKIVSLSPRCILNYSGDVLFTLAEPPMLCIFQFSSGAWTELIHLGTPKGLIIIRFCSFPRVPFLCECRGQTFNKRCSTSSSKRKS